MISIPGTPIFNIDSPAKKFAAGGSAHVVATGCQGGVVVGAVGVVGGGAQARVQRRVADV